MNPTLIDYYAQLASIILHWWDAISLGVSLFGMVIIFFFTMHKGFVYRISYLTLIIIGICYVYGILLEDAPKKPTLTDALLPVFFSALAWVSWSRSSLLLVGFARHRKNLKELAETDLSAETDWLPYLETSLFAERMERWQKWLYMVVAGAFAGAILNTNVTGVEKVLAATLSTYKTVQVQVSKSQQNAAKIASDLREKNVKDSLWHIYVIDDRKKQLAAVNGLTEQVKKIKQTKPALTPERVTLPIPKAKSIQLKGTSNQPLKVGRSTSHNEVPNPAPDTTLNYPVARANKYQ